MVTPVGPKTPMSTEVVQVAQRRRFSLRHRGFARKIGSVLTGGIGAAVIDRIGWMAEGITAAMESLFVMTLVGLGIGWMYAFLSGKNREAHLENALLRAENADLQAQLKTQGPEFKPGGSVFVRGRKRYEIIKLIGEGGFGKVWLVKNIKMDRIEVMKVGHRHLFADKENAQRLAKECRNHASVEHENVAKVHHFYGREEYVTEEEQELLNGQSGFTMEYVKGQPLSERIVMGHRFQESEFKGRVDGLKKISQKLEADGYGSLATYKGRDEHYTIEKLNALLDRPDFYDIWKGKPGNASINIPPDVQMQIASAVERTEGYRDLKAGEYAKLSQMEDKALSGIPVWVRYMNRLLIEVTYPELCPKSGPLKPRDAIEVVLQTLAGLEAAHKKGLIHRDIKPANIMVLNEGPEVQVKILDFGISKSENDPDKTRGAVVQGSIFYMAPEQHQQGTATPQTDFYALGIMLHELLYGNVPYAEFKSAIRDWQDKGSPAMEKNSAGIIELNPLQKFQKQITAGAMYPDINEEIVPEQHRLLLRRVFQNMLNRIQESRYRSHAELRRDLGALKAVFSPEEEPPVPTDPNNGPGNGGEGSPVEGLRAMLMKKRAKRPPKAQSGPSAPAKTTRGIGAAKPEKPQRVGPARPEGTLPGITPEISDQPTITLGDKDKKGK